jgi:hypothetical protein
VIESDVTITGVKLLKAGQMKKKERFGLGVWHTMDSMSVQGRGRKWPSEWSVRTAAGNRLSLSLSLSLSLFLFFRLELGVLLSFTNLTVDIVRPSLTLRDGRNSV